ncbi:MAG: hypothetical protein ABH827_01305, partial [bacterium]
METIKKKVENFKRLSNENSNESIYKEYIDCYQQIEKIKLNTIFAKDKIDKEDIDTLNKKLAPIEEELNTKYMEYLKDEDFLISKTGQSIKTLTDEITKGVENLREEFKQTETTGKQAEDLYKKIEEPYNKLLNIEDALGDMPKYMQNLQKSTAVATPDTIVIFDAVLDLYFSSIKTEIEEKTKDQKEPLNKKLEALELDFQKFKKSKNRTLTDAELSKYFEDFTKKKDDFFKTDEEILAERVSSLQQALECLKEKLI